MEDIPFFNWLQFEQESHHLPFEKMDD